jgi:hypothetical protein
MLAMNGLLAAGPPPLMAPHEYHDCCPGLAVRLADLLMAKLIA